MIAAFIIILLLAAAAALICLPFIKQKPKDYTDPKVLRKMGYEMLLPAVLESQKYIESHNCEELEILSFDGKKLRGILLPRENARGTIILMHGWHSGRQLDFSSAVELYHSQGLNLIICDQRAHGHSGGLFTTFGVKESRDAESWVIYAGQLFGKEHPIFLGGISMGASTVMMASDIEFEENIRGIIADCGFTSPFEIMEHVIKSRVPHFPAKAFLNLLRGPVRLIAGFDIKGKNSVDCVKNSRLPILFVHGEDDSFVPCEMSRRCFEASGERGTLVTVKGAGHGMSYPTDPERTAAALRDFINKNI